MSSASSPTRRLLPEGLEPESLVVGLSGLTVRAGVATACVRCPVCERPSRKVHSRYGRRKSLGGPALPGRRALSVSGEKY